MKRIILAITIIIGGLTTSYAQNALNKVPAGASMIIKYSGDNFSKSLPLKKIDSYNFIKDNLFKALKIDSINSLEGLGINFGQDTYQYITMEDSSFSFVSLLHLNNPALFLKLLDANYHAEMKPEKKNGYELLALSSDTYIGWNNDQAVLVVTKYQNSERYPYYYSPVDSVYTGQAPVEDAVKETIPANEEKLEDMDTLVVQKAKVPKPKTNKNKPVVKNKKAPAKKPVKKPAEVIEEEVITDPETIAEAKKNYEDSLQDANRAQWYLEQEIKTKERQKLVAENIISNNFTGSILSIENDISYKKVIDPAAHVSLWFNYQNLLNQYWSSFFKGFGPSRYYGATPMHKNSGNKDEAFRSGMNLYFDKDKMRIEQRSFSPDEQMANLGRDLFNSKQSTALANYVNPDNIGYLSMSINTEAMANYYYKLIKQYLSSSPYVGEFGDIVDVYIDLLEIIIDEKAIAELMPGNSMFVLHDIKTKQVTYTDYEYDADFKYKEIKKTKQELSPNFTFVMETKRDAFLQKVVNLPLKYAKKEHFNYQDRGGYYELVFEEGKYPISSIYFMVKNGKLIITTSRASIDMTLSNTGYTLDAETKNSVLNNNYSMKINSKQLIQQLGPELNSGTNKKITSYLQENVGNLSMEGRLKNGMMQGTTTMAITGNHTNSLEFFFNMIDAINDIMEKDKAEREQKLN